MRVNCPTNKLNFATCKQPRSTQTPLSPMEITVSTVFEQHRTPRLSCDDQSINTDEGVREKPNWPGLHRDVECCE